MLNMIMFLVYYVVLPGQSWDLSGLCSLISQVSINAKGQSFYEKRFRPFIKPKNEGLSFS